MERILFLCLHNSSRSQMAEGFARHIMGGGKEIEIWSAGTEPRGVNPYAVRVMAEKEIDLSGHTSKHVDKVPPPTRVVTLCGESEETCPAFPGGVIIEHWGLPDPSRAEGSDEEKLRVFRAVRDEIERRIRELADRVLSPDF
ncbi:MAG: arsenate reductase ArsC [Acidobacteria bacterium]|nr:arsenate reductase ArsC [Acidobacteriota bacterium]